MAAQPGASPSAPRNGISQDSSCGCSTAGGAGADDARPFHTEITSFVSSLLLLLLLLVSPPVVHVIGLHTIISTVVGEALCRSGLAVLTVPPLSQATHTHATHGDEVITGARLT